MSVWCEHCRDHYPEDHYRGGRHRVGRDFGVTGTDLARREAYEDALRMIAVGGRAGGTGDNLAKIAQRTLEAWA